MTTSDALGNTVTNGYDTNGNLTSTVSGAGVATYYKYDPNNNLKQVTSSPPQRPFGPPPQGAITVYGYDSSGYMNSSTSPTGVVVTYKPPDPNGNQTGTIENWTDPKAEKGSGVFSQWRPRGLACRHVRAFADGFQRLRLPRAQSCGGAALRLARGVNGWP